jgi:class 3 adenylate cyclase/TolB-like protein/Flp pilus assembly protein TadD
MSEERFERKLAAILAADIVGYSRLMGADEEGTHGSMKAILREVGDPKIAEHRGRLVKTTGDGFLVEFTSVVDAVRCALEFQRAMTDRNAGALADKRIDFRIGINVGDVIIDGDDIYGDGVNIAARLEALAEPGGVYVSARVHEYVTGMTEVRFEDLGKRSLKNIKRPVRVYRVRGAAELGALPLPGREKFIVGEPEQGTSAAPDPDTLLAIVDPAPSSARPSILVLPFRNATGDPKQEYFTDAVTADLTVDLSRMRDIVVISAASAFTYKDRHPDTRQIGRELGVRYLVLGSIARIGELVRTNVQLVVAASGEQLWGDRFEYEFADLGRLENAITGRIAASLNVQLMRAEGRRAEKSIQPDALDLRLRATSMFFGSIAPEHTLAVRQLLQQSVNLDPHSAEAWARLAEVTVSDHLNRWNNTSKEHVHDAEDAVRKALLIDPSNALAHVASGLIHRARGDHHSALEAFSRAIELDPNFAFAYVHKGSELALLGRSAETPPLVEQALRLSPHDPSIGIFHWTAGRASFFAGQYDRAVSWLQKSVQARPNLWYNRLYLVSAYALLEKSEEAARALGEFNRRFSQPVYTLAVVKLHEDSNPNSDPAVVAGRDKFHEGLLQAGMAEH